MTSTHSDRIVHTDTGDTGSAKLENFRISDNRPEAALQRKEMESIPDSPLMTSQRANFIESPGDNVSAIANNTGMPDHLKSGLEQLSGFDLSDVKVHYNSSRPESVGALAYAQGNHIHLGPGQENHLPHESWHVVQQKQGRVKANTLINGQPVNDNPKLEQEASAMGAKASSALPTGSIPKALKTAAAIPGNSMQQVTQLQVKIKGYQEAEGKTARPWTKKIFVITSGRPRWTPALNQAFYEHVKEKDPEFADGLMDDTGNWKNDGWQKGHITSWNIVRDAFVETKLNGRTRKEWKGTLEQEKGLRGLTEGNIDAEIQKYIIEKVEERFNSIDDENLDNLWPTLKKDDNDRGNRAEANSKDASDVLKILSKHKLTAKEVEEIEDTKGNEDNFGEIYRWIKLNFFRLQDQKYAQKQFTEEEILEQKVLHIEQVMAAYGRRYPAIAGLKKTLDSWSGAERLKQIREEAKAAEEKQTMKEKAKEERIAKQQKEKENKRQLMLLKKAKEAQQLLERNRDSRNKKIQIAMVLMVCVAAILYYWLM